MWRHPAEISTWQEITKLECPAHVMLSSGGAWQRNAHCHQQLLLIAGNMAVTPICYVVDKPVTDEIRDTRYL
jgi:hypothetical protein